MRGNRRVWLRFDENVVKFRKGYELVPPQIFMRCEAAHISGRSLSSKNHQLFVDWYIFTGQPPISNQMSGFDAINDCLCRLKGLKPHHGTRYFLDE